MQVPPPLRVVVADDSAFMRRLLSEALSKSGFEVVAAVEDGDQALRASTSLHPDVLTLDLAMPGLDGLGVLRELRATGSPVPVVVVSAFSPAHGARAVDALAEGAVDLVAKPAAGEDLRAFLAELAEKVRLAASSSQRREPAPAAAAVRARPRIARPGRRRRPRPVVIACSTGGPKALAELVPKLPSPLGAGALLVQHMPAGFTGSLAARLDRASPLTVREAATGDSLDPGTILVAPGGKHLRLRDDRTAALTDDPSIGGLRPRADLTIVDAAKMFGSDLLLVVLTGMGKDGLEGAHEVRRRGGTILVEDESTCTIYGMPRAIVEAGLADGVHPLTRLPDAIAAEVA
ncbi:MAG TPA: chemotaxis-specific protein-glutamate methyltransferase CheB [Gaiellaceae bacterium]|nr:chemotaxis-specific protein-glutamate methyltransferase CheB [Gaiellaceae bacterium]